jgi:hypothetical protein
MWGVPHTAQCVHAAEGRYPTRRASVSHRRYHRKLLWSEPAQRRSWFTKRLERGRAGSTSPNRRELPRHTFSFLGLVSPSLTLHLGNPRRPSIVFLMSVVRVKSDKCASNVRSGAILETTLKIRIND